MHKYWGVGQWKRIIYSNESKFNLIDADGRVKVWRQKGERYSPECTLKTVRGGGDSLMFWGCIGYNFIGPLIEIKGSLDAKLYISHVLETFFSSFWKKKRKKNLIFMQDNAPCHRAKKVMKWFGQKKIKVLEWPPQSPDINPIETLWDKLLRSVREMEIQPKNLSEFRGILIQKWANIPIEEIKQLYRGLPKRMAALRIAKGNATKY